MTDKFLTQQLIEQRIKQWLAQHKSVNEQDISSHASWVDFDIDSINSAQLLGDLEGYLQIECDLMLLKDYPTIEALAKHLTALSLNGSINTTQQASVDYQQYLRPKQLLNDD